MSCRVVGLMRLPAVRHRLRSELAALPQQLVSYEELLASFIDYGNDVALILLKAGDTGAFADIRTAARLASGLLPLLVPDNPRLLYEAAASAKGISPGPHAPAARTRHLTMLPAAFAVARQQGSDFYIAASGYAMANLADDWEAESSVQQGLPAPSTVLGWLQQAEAAHRCCKAVLPKQWTIMLRNFKAMAAPVKARLLQMQRHGDRWCRLAPSTRQELNAAYKVFQEARKDYGMKQLMCNGCGNWAPQLRVCGACREVQYCR